MTVRVSDRAYDEGFSPPPRMEWMTGAACLQHDPEMFHPGPGEARHAYAGARRVCAGCPVRVDCLDYALTAVEPLTGMWGGLTEQQRARLRGTRARLGGWRRAS